LDHLENQLSLADLAGEVGVSEAHLSRAFKVSTGMAPWRWLAVRRIERAKELLADPRLSLTDVAQITGYSGQSAFGEAFRRATGVAPGQYRRAL
jgi:transcriptional regulator GlxA family with amidase domain